MSDARKNLVDPEGLLKILELVRVLARPFELAEVLTLVINAGRGVLGADRGTVFLYDKETEELYSTVATGNHEIRFPVSRGIAGECARTRSIVNVHDCYADTRFNPEVDRQTGYRTRNLITVPLIGLDEELVGVMQLLNSPKPFFDATDERIATVLADQAGVAIQRVRLLQERLAKLKMERDLTLARDIQQKVLPKELPDVPGYELAVYSKPADMTGGDIYDLIPLMPTVIEERLAKSQKTESESDESEDAPASEDAKPTPLVILLADATGHGIGPALSVTQVRSMVRIAMRFDTDVESVINQVNNQLCQDLDITLFVTAFVGKLDPVAHRLDYHACGQGPILHFHAADSSCDQLNATTVPLGVLENPPLTWPDPLVLERGDFVLLITDGFFECHNPDREMMGADRVIELLAQNRHLSAQEFLAKLIEATTAFANGAPQMDDLTAIILKRK